MVADTVRVSNGARVTFHGRDILVRTFPYPTNVYVLMVFKSSFQADICKRSVGEISGFEQTDLL